MAEPEEGMYATVGLFRTNARLVKSTLDALSELIKNSYDADASTVTLVLEDAFKPLNENPQIIIKDDGHGMSMDDIQSKWKRVGDSKKVREQYSPKLRRALQGSKGVGRLGAWKIGERVTVYSRKREHEPVGVCFDIRNLRNDQPFGDIREETLTDAGDYFGPGEFGTIILIQGFLEQIQQAGAFCRNLNLDLMHLPDPFSDMSDFKIHQVYPPDIVDNVDDFTVRSLAENAPYVANLRINAGNIIEGEFQNNNPYCDRSGSKQVSFSYPAPHGVNLRDFDIKIRAYPLTKLYSFARILPGRNQPIGTDVFKKISGFRLYKDRVRIRPYGENYPNKDDWLGIDKTYTNRHSSVFRQEQIIATASFKQARNPALRQPASRLGLEDNESSEYLKQVLLEVCKEFRKFAGNIPQQKPSRLMPPNLTYPFVTVDPGKPFESPPPMNNGGEITAIHAAKNLVFSNLNATKAGIISGTAPEKPGTYEIQVNAKNQHGKSETKLLVVVNEPQKVSPDAEENFNQEGPLTLPTPLIPPVTPPQRQQQLKTQLKTSSSHLVDLLPLLDDEAHVEKIQHLIETLKTMLEEL